tara:strand:- start:241 stop:537 length:297 start_codon:yes stop_codon:yes gene_type:complete
MIDTDKYEGHQVSDFKTSVAGPNHTWVTHQQRHGHVEALLLKHATAALVTDAPLLLEEVIRLRKENKILAKYMDIVQKYDDALLADGDTDPRWSELYD